MGMERILERMPNAVFGVSGQVFHGWYGGASDVARHCPLDRLVLETDSPYLAGEPREILTIAGRVAEIKNIKIETVLSETTRTCERFYGIGPFRNSRIFK